MTESKNLIRYVVITSSFWWGKGETMKEALENAHVNQIYALNSKVKNPKEAVVYRIELDPIKSVINDLYKSRAELALSCVSLDEDYQEGDLVEPWVDLWGHCCSWGAKNTEEVIRLKIK